MIGIKQMPESERPREKMLSSGASSLSNAELLALVIGSGTKDDSAIALAMEVLSMADGAIRSLYNCQPEEFMKLKGIGRACACRLAASIEFGRRLAAAAPPNRVKFEIPKDAAELFMEDMRHLQQERLRVALLNSKGELIAMDDVTVGGLYSSSASPREVFSKAVRKGAYAVILAHNHPSGDPTPSDDDINVTRQIAAAGDLLGIYLLDHIIIGDGRYISLKEIGII